MCWWTASFSFALGPGFLLHWQDALLSAGEETSVFRVEAMEQINYVRERDGDLAAFRTSPDLAPETDEWLPTGFILHLFDALPEDHTSTLLAYADQQGQVAETWVPEMRGFRRTARTAQHVRLPTVQRRAPHSGPGASAEDGVVQPGLLPSTDIWLPWTSASSHRDAVETDSEILDNRTLATSNGTRLNRFLRRVRNAAAGLGGDWEVHPRAPIFKPQVTEDGVILDGPRPSTQVSGWPTPCRAIWSGKTT